MSEDWTQSIDEVLAKYKDKPCALSEAARATEAGQPPDPRPPPPLSEEAGAPVSK